jgi:hypothetical protein
MTEPETHDQGFQPLADPVFDIEYLDVAAWCPDVAGLAPPEQVHLRLKIRGLKPLVVARFKSPDTLAVVIEQLCRYRREVWPDSRPVGEGTGGGEGDGHAHGARQV